MLCICIHILVLMIVDIIDYVCVHGYGCIIRILIYSTELYIMVVLSVEEFFTISFGIWKEEGIFCLVKFL